MSRILSNKGVHDGQGSTKTWVSRIARNRFRPTDIERLEGRVVLSATTLAVAAASGTYGGTTNLLAHLSSGANNVSGEIIDFQLGGHELGTAVTDSNGLAFINNVSLTGITSFNVGNFTNAVTAEFTGDAGAGFTGSSGSANLTVFAAPLTITANNQTKVYGASLPMLTVTYTGFVNGDTSASLSTPPTITTTATAASHVAGGPYLITASGAVDSNYSISYVDGNLTVTTAPLTITANNQIKSYGASLPTLTASYTGFVNGDTSASLSTPPSITTTATAASHVAGSPYNITGSGAVDTDYSISYVTGHLTITTVPLTITANNQTKVYGAALPTLTASYTGFVNGDTSASLATPPSINTSALASSHVAGSPYSISASGAIDTDYSISYVAGNLTILTAPLTITANDQTKVYGAALPTLTASYTGLVNGDTPADLGTAPTITTTALASSHVVGSPYAITIGGAADPDYTISYVDGTLAVTAAPLTISADNLSKVYGAPVPTLTASYTGLVNGDTSDDLTTLPTITTTATAASHVSPLLGNPFVNTISGAVDSDYTITYVPGTLIVTPAPLTITADSQTKVYGAALPTLTASYKGFVNGDTPASLATLPTITTMGTAASNVSGSPYAIYSAGAVDPDYTIEYVAGHLAVTPAPLTISADNLSKVYGSALPSLTATYTGLVNGDTSASLIGLPNLSTTARSSSNAGTYPITVSGPASTNYTIAFTPGVFTITPAILTVTPINVVKPYGTPIPPLKLNYSGFVNGDTQANLTTPEVASTTATKSSTFGTYPITVSGGSSPNYTIVNAQGTLTIPVNPIQNAFVTSVYQYTLGRTPEPSALNGWLAQLNNGTSQFSVVSQIYNSQEAAANRSAKHTPASSSAPARIALVSSLFQSILGRAPEVAGFNAWVTRMNRGENPAQVANDIYNSKEAVSVRANVPPPSPPSHDEQVAVVSALYETAINHNPDAAGLNNWLTRLNDGENIAQVANEIYSSLKPGARRVNPKVRLR